MKLGEVKLFGFAALVLLLFCATDADLKSQSFDFIVVGGGTAGCVVASRLSESGKYSVLLLEAGRTPPDFLEVPGLAIQNQFNDDVTFQYFSVPQKHVSRQVFRQSLGKVLGGTSQINYSLFNRGSPMDYDNWANLTGDDSWKYSNMLKYFRKAETYLGFFPSEIHHGSQGPIPISFQHFAPAMGPWLAAGRELGFQIRDPNGPQEISFAPIEVSRRFGRRMSSYKAYLEPIIKSRGNLRIITDAYVTEVLFDANGTKAIGVSFNLNETENIVFAKREVILSAGTYGSATLLMRSGIGPKKVLEAAGVSQIKELPVGENLQGHPLVPFHIILNNKSLSYDPDVELNPKNLDIWKRYGMGPYSDVMGYSGQSFFASTVAASEGHGDWPDIQFLMASSNSIMSPFRRNYIAPWETSIQLDLNLGREKSRGTVKLDPNDKNGEPIIDFNYLSDPRDEEILLEAIKSALHIFEDTKVYQRLEARIFFEPLPLCKHLRFRSDKYWRCYIRRTLQAGNHPAGTCSMNSVVDSKLRVFGIRKLVVIDASVMQMVTNANLHAAVYGIAEKASEDILRVHNDNNNNVVLK